MNTSLRARVFGQPRTDLCLDDEQVPAKSAAFWWINGYRARLLIWTRDEWEKMPTPPPDAQFHPHGVWCALRLD